jgi:hypothetical protein
MEEMSGATFASGAAACRQQQCVAAAPQQKLSLPARGQYPGLSAPKSATGATLSGGGEVSQSVFFATHGVD